MQRSTLKTAINIMIYGVTIFLNDVNFSLKNREKQVVSRMSYHHFFTNKTKAKQAYDWNLSKWKSEKGISYSNYDQRGSAEMYKARVQDGQIMNWGEIIYKESI